MSNIIPFNSESHSIRVCLDENNAPWFNAKDVCGVLGYSNARKSVADHVDSEDVTKRDTLSWRCQTVSIIWTLAHSHIEIHSHTSHSRVHPQGSTVYGVSQHSHDSHD